MRRLLPGLDPVPRMEYHSRSSDGQPVLEPELRDAARRVVRGVEKTPVRRKRQMARGLASRGETFRFGVTAEGEFVQHDHAAVTAPGRSVEPLGSGAADEAVQLGYPELLERSFRLKFVDAAVGSVCSGHGEKFRTPRQEQRRSDR